MARTLLEIGYQNVKVVDGGWNAMKDVGFPIMAEGKIIFPKSKIAGGIPGAKGIFK